MKNEKKLNSWIVSNRKDAVFICASIFVRYTLGCIPMHKHAPLSNLDLFTNELTWLNTMIYFFLQNTAPSKSNHYVLLNKSLETQDLFFTQHFQSLNQIVPQAIAMKKKHFKSNPYSISHVNKFIFVDCSHRTNSGRNWKKPHALYATKLAWYTAWLRKKLLIIAVFLTVTNEVYFSPNSHPDLIPLTE